MPNVADRQEVEGTPYEFDRWVLQLTSGLIARLSSEQEAREFWQPIMDLGPGAHYWIESFFGDWFLTGRQHAPTLEVFGDRWKEMIAYSFEAPKWAIDSPSHRLDDCCIEVMGLGLTLSIIAAEEFTPVITSLSTLFEKWGQNWLAHSRPASNFAYFVSKPAGRALLPSAIIWLNSGVQSMSKHVWREPELSDALAGAVRTCWRYHRSTIATDAELQKHFLQLLNTLCNRLNADALGLRADVSQLISLGT